MAGRIIEVGQEVSGLKVGDRVGVWTTHQQFFKIRPEQAHPLPAPISYEEATWLNLACTAQMGVRRAELHLGETVGVVGAGMVGQLVVQYLLLSGARKIIAIDPVRGRLDVAEAHGATHTLAMDVGSARPEIERITDGRLLDVVYDITGHPAVLASCLRLVRKLGRVILLGDTPTPTQQHLGPGVVSDSIAILGVHGSMTPANSSPYNPWTRKEVTALFFEYVIQKRMSVSDLISNRHSPLDAPRVYADLVKHNSSEIGVIFDWSLL